MNSTELKLQVKGYYQVVSHGESCPLPYKPGSGFQYVPAGLKKAVQISFVNLQVGQIAHRGVVVRVQPKGLDEALRSLCVVPDDQIMNHKRLFNLN